MVVQLKIVLDHPTAAALTGSEVSGTVVVQTREPIGKKYKSIKILLKGKGTVSVAGYDGGTTGDENYVNLEKELWNRRQSSGPDREPTTEEYHFPFQFTLSSSLPSSFESNDDSPSSVRNFPSSVRNSVVRQASWIRYYIIAHILPNSALHNSYFTKVPLKVAKVIDINMPELDRPMQFEKQKTTGCLWCASGPITTTAKVPRTGYCAGEEIPFQVTVENGSNRRIECVVKLLQNTELSTQQCCFKYNHSVATASHATRRNQPIEPHTTNTWESTLTVPGNTPVTIDTEIIKRYFTLVMSVSIPNAGNSVIAIPLIIGNVPYHQDVHPSQ